jgi:hypothetical protein
MRNRNTLGITAIILLIFALILLFTSCSTPQERKLMHYHDNYSYYIKDIVPDSNKEKLKLFILDGIKNTNFHMSGGDYEDPEDVAESLENIGTRLYSVQKEGLLIKTEIYNDFKEKSSLDSNELLIFNILKNEKNHE